MWEDDAENLFGPKDEIITLDEDVDPRAIYVPAGSTKDSCAFQLVPGHQVMRCVVQMWRYYKLVEAHVIPVRFDGTVPAKKKTNRAWH